MIRRPPRSTLFPYTDALPISSSRPRDDRLREASGHARRQQRRGASQPHRTRTQADRKSTRLNSSHLVISYAVFCLKKKMETEPDQHADDDHEEYNEDIADEFC